MKIQKNWSSFLKNIGYWLKKNSSFFNAARSQSHAALETLFETPDINQAKPWKYLLIIVLSAGNTTSDIENYILLQLIQFF